MGIRNAYGTDKTLAEEGQWFTFGDGSEWLIRKATSKKAQDAMRLARKPYQELIRSTNLTGDELPPHIADKLNIQYAVDGLVVTWRKLVDEEVDPSGAEIPFSKELCTKYLTEMPDLLLGVIRASTGLSNFQKRKEEVETATKNS